MTDYMIELASKNAFQEIPPAKLNSILAGINSYEKIDRIQAVVMAVSEGYKLGFKRSEESEKIRRNLAKSRKGIQ